MQTKIILVVDDDKAVRTMTAGVLRYLGFVNVIQAEDGSEGIKMIEEHNPDLVMTDLTMPEMRGEELIRWIVREHKPKFPLIKIIALSGDDQTVAEPEARAAGADDYIAKPFMIPDLKRAITTLLA